MVRISVADHGLGIPSRDLERIFERFYRVDHGRSRNTGGTGLGLSIVRHVANNHQGRVDVESREGEGSTFTLVLPLQQDRGGLTMPQARTGEDRSIKVLIAEDEESFVDALVVGLGHEGFIVHVARDGNGALRLFETVDPDVVLLDQMLPGRGLRPRRVPVDPGHLVGPDHHGHRQGHRDRHGRGARGRRRRLRHQAVPDARAGGPHPGGVPPLPPPGQARRGGQPRRARTARSISGEVTVDAVQRRVFVRGDEVRLRRKEFDLLNLLVENSGRVLTRDVLIDRVWGSDYIGDTKTLDVHIKRLRSQIEVDPAEPHLITTVRGVGYRFADPTR